MPGPMQGVKVVETTRDKLAVELQEGTVRVISEGEQTELDLGGLLADWGADVVKIEPPGVGDPARTFGAMVGADLAGSPPFEMDNRSKRSIVIDLRTPDGMELALELIDQADVFISNVRQASLTPGSN